MSHTIFREPCRFCSSVRHELSTAGVDVCPRCDQALSLIGQRPAGISAADFRNLVLEVASVADFVPQQHAEKFPAWRPRVILALDARRKGQPLPSVLLRPLSDAALKAFQDGKSASAVVFTASQISMQPKAPAAPPRKSRIEKPAGGLKIW
jgi:hypothetical protein